MPQNVITLAHMSTRLFNYHDASLNHFDELIIEPKAIEKQRIQELQSPLHKKTDSPKDHKLHTLHTSLFSPDTASIAKRTNPSVIQVEKERSNNLHN